MTKVVYELLRNMIRVHNGLEPHKVSICATRKDFELAKYYFNLYLSNKR